MPSGIQWPIHALSSIHQCPPSFNDPWTQWLHSPRSSFIQWPHSPNGCNQPMASFTNAARSFKWPIHPVTHSPMPTFMPPFIQSTSQPMHHLPMPSFTHWLLQQMPHWPGAVQQMKKEEVTVACSMPAPQLTCVRKWLIQIFSAGLCGCWLLVSKLGSSDTMLSNVTMTLFAQWRIRPMPWIHSMIHAPNDSFTNALIHSMTHSPSDSCHQCPHSFNDPFTQWLIHQCPHSFNDPWTQWLIHQWPIHHVLFSKARKWKWLKHEVAAVGLWCRARSLFAAGIKLHICRCAYRCNKSKQCAHITKPHTKWFHWIHKHNIMPTLLIRP